MPERDTTITLRDGRLLAFTEHGDLSGKPVIFLHGNPSSRLMRHPDETIVEKLGARVITPDRPGYGRSAYQPDRKLLDYPEDIAQLADALELDRFAIFGVSAGGPYVAACAHQLPHRITRAAIVSGAAPMNRRGAFQGMHPAWKSAFRASRDLPGWMLRMPLWIQSQSANRTPEQALTNFASMLTPADREKLYQPEIKARVVLSRAESTRQGHRGWIREAKIIMSRWGFRLGEIQVPVHLWYWEGDQAIPPQMGRYLEKKIPQTVAHFFPGGGHLSIYDYWGEIIAALIEEEVEPEETEVVEEAEPPAIAETCQVCEVPPLIYTDDLFSIRHQPPAAVGETAVLGALLLEPQRYVATLADLTDAEAAHLGLLTVRLSRALQTRTGAAHVDQCVVPDAESASLQLQLFPRYPQTPRESWGAQIDRWPDAPRGDAAQIAELCRQLRAALPSPATEMG